MEPRLRSAPWVLERTRGWAARRDPSPMASADLYERSRPLQYAAIFFSHHMRPLVRPCSATPCPLSTLSTRSQQQRVRLSRLARRGYFDRPPGPHRPICGRRRVSSFVGSSFVYLHLDLAGLAGLAAPARRLLREALLGIHIANRRVALRELIRINVIVILLLGIRRQGPCHVSSAGVPRVISRRREEVGR